MPAVAARRRLSAIATHTCQCSVGAAGASDDSARSGSLYTNVDFPKDDEGRVHHLSVKEGEVANRIISVGDPTRALALAALFDDNAETLRVDSHRPGAFTTFTGRFSGVPVSVIATGMGTPNMDFIVREARGVVSGPMAIVRFGSCGVVQADTAPGSICVATEGSISVTRNVDAYLNPASAAIGTARGYNLSLPAPAHEGLSQLLTECLSAAVGPDKVSGGMNATCDSFYSSQGRASSHFDDRNDDLIKVLNQERAQVVTMEMETFQLLHLARCCNAREPIAASAVSTAMQHASDMLASFPQGRFMGRSEQLQSCSPRLMYGVVCALVSSSHCRR
jgi:uridine phosphorylase